MWNNVSYRHRLSYLAPALLSKISIFHKHVWWMWTLWRKARPWCNHSERFCQDLIDDRFVSWSSWSELWNSFVIINEVPLKHRRQAHSQQPQCILSGTCCNAEVFLKPWFLLLSVIRAECGKVSGTTYLSKQDKHVLSQIITLKDALALYSCLMTKCIDVLII